MDVKLSGKNTQGLYANVILKDREEQLLWKDEMDFLSDGDSSEGSFEREMSEVKPWDNHSPYMYHFYLEILNERGELLEIIPYRGGFRRIEIIDRVMYLNGKRLIIVGVNRHEWNAKDRARNNYETFKNHISDEP